MFSFSAAFAEKQFSDLSTIIGVFRCDMHSHRVSVYIEVCVRHTNDIHITKLILLHFINSQSEVWKLKVAVIGVSTSIIWLYHVACITCHYHMAKAYGEYHMARIIWREHVSSSVLLLYPVHPFEPNLR